MNINRPTINRPTTVINRPVTNINQNINIQGGTTVNNIINNTTVINRGNIHGFTRPYWNNHRAWYHGSWSGWNAWPSFWAGYAAGTWHGMVLGSGGWYTPVVPVYTFYNPYFIPPPVVVETVIEPSITILPVFDYSRPIAAPKRDEDVLEADIEESSSGYIAAARAAFRKSQYATARRDIDRALKLVPGDTLTHEFRALTLFAEGKYEDAAGVLYAVLAKGPGWDWDTMSAFYPPGENYSRQLKALEVYCKENEKSAEAHFLLGYHYLVLNEKEAAASAFAVASEIQPKDKLSASLAAALSAPGKKEED